MNATLQNALIYLSTAIMPPVADAVYQYIVARTAGGGQIDWQQVVTVALLAALGAYVTANRPRVGSEGLASDVNELRAAGVSRKDMAVVAKGAARPGRTTEASQV